MVLTNTVKTQLQILTAVVKLFLKKPEQAQGLVQKVLQAATAESDNPDVRDRAYVYWRLLSSDPNIAKVSLPERNKHHLLTRRQNVVLAQRPQVTSTISSLPAPLLDSLLPNLSTLSSVYHKLPSSFLGQGRSGAASLQQAALDEAAENARENPIAAAAAAAVVGQAAGAPARSNAENLLDIDFDGSAPASMQKQPFPGSSGLEGLAGTPQRMASPVQPRGPASGMDDLMGVFGNDNLNGSSVQPVSKQMGNDLLDGFASLDMAAGQPPPPQRQLDGGGGGNDDDLLG